MDGKYRAPDDSERMRPQKSGGAKAPKLSPESGVVINTENGVTTIRSTKVPRFGELPNWLFLGGAIMGVVALGDVRVGEVIADPAQDPGRTAMAVLASLLAAGFGLRFGIETFRFLNSANVLTIDATHVRYQGRAVPLTSISEVTYVHGPVIIGKKKSIEISPEFCETKESPAFVAELRRFVIAGADAGAQGDSAV